MHFHQQSDIALLCSADVVLSLPSNVSFSGTDKLLSVKGTADA
jgi:hypothetical protein